MSEPTPPAPERELRGWRSLFQHASDAVFVLNRQRRILTVNCACEALLGREASAVRGLACSSRSSMKGPKDWRVLAAALCPPPAVLAGETSHVRRPVSRPGLPREWWDIEYLPLRDRKGRLRIVGKITRALVEPAPAGVPLPESLLVLRERRDREYDWDSVASAAPALRLMTNQARLAAQCRTPTLLVGEAGTGKEWLARVIHRHGPARERKFAALDCRALPASLAGDLLFGASGLLATPAIGTLFIRDIDHLARELQDRLHEWLEASAEGGPRLIAGCCGDPAQAVHSGRLLEALYCTLGTLVIAVPPLRQRRHDLPALAARMQSRARGNDGDKPAALSHAALEVLSAYTWPGNLRELYAVLEDAQERARADTIEAHDLPLPLRIAAGVERAPATPPRPLALDSILEQVERRLIAVALRRAGGNKSKAAAQLSIWRARLVRRIETLGLDQQKPPPQA